MIDSSKQQARLIMETRQLNNDKVPLSEEQKTILKETERKNYLRITSYQHFRKSTFENSKPTIWKRKLVIDIFHCCLSM